MFNVLLRHLLKSRSGLGFFARSSLGLTRRQGEVPAGTEDRSGRSGFPMPLPFPEALRKGWVAPADVVARKKMMNVVVITFNYLVLGRPSRPPANLRVGASLSSQQWEIIRRLEHFLEAWIFAEGVGPEAMGRTAPKVEGIEKTLLKLSSKAQEFVSAGASDYFRCAAGKCSDLGPTRDAGTVVGHSAEASFSTFKQVEPSRLTFVGEPLFDPVPYLDERSAAVFLHPLANSMSPEEFVGSIPRVRVHCSKAKKIALFELLDKSGRLALHEPASVRPKFAAGVFSVVKDLERDRLILDSRPANLLETTLDHWIRSLSSAEALTKIRLPETCELRVSGNDLRDFYYMFGVSEERSRRNILCGPVLPSEVRHLSCYKDEFEKASLLYGSLATMAMGDCQAVALAQTCHVSMALQHGIFLPTELITLEGLLPRGPDFFGIIIDDFISLSIVPVGSSEKTRGASAAEKMQQVYKEKKLIPHEKKAFRDSSTSSFWGVDVDGSKGLVRGSLKRAIPLCWILLQVSALGFCTVELLQTLAGSVVSLFLFRRRLLCLLDSIFQACRGRDGDCIVKLSGRLKGELLLLAIFLPFSCSNLKAQVRGRVTATDASTWWEASCTAAVPQPVADELYRHVLRKSVWTRLLPPGKAWERAHGLLDSAAELPGDEEFKMNPLWQLLATCLRYRLLKRKKATSRRHINIGELRASLAAEEKLAKAMPCSRELICMDSQVCLGALIKGRSASPSLNWELSCSLPTMLGYDCYSDYCYFESSLNPADDPTRQRPLREPVCELPAWWLDVCTGDFSEFDSWLESHNLGSHTLSGLPPFSDLGFNAQFEPVDSTSFGLSCPAAEEAPFDSLDSDRCISGGCETADVAPTAQCDLLMPSTCPVPGDSAISEMTTFEGIFGTLDAGACREVSEFFGGLSANQKHKPVGSSWPPTTPGYLDLFAGKKGVAKSWVRDGFGWAVSYDFADGPQQDLLDPSVRALLERMLVLGIFCGWGAALVCSSFSVAITPPVRNAEFPEGRPDVSERMQVKICEGNSFGDWVLKLLLLSEKLFIGCWVENPDLSWLFRQPKWLEFQTTTKQFGCWRFDMCRFGRKWRKRTRVLMNLFLKGTSTFCTGCKHHFQLRGRSKLRKKSWTLVAQPYPKGVCRTLARAVAVFAGRAERRAFDGGSFARVCHRRIGEAQNPGPIGRRDTPLESVPLLEAKTMSLQSKVWSWFVRWVTEQSSATVAKSLTSEPTTLHVLLAEFGKHLFSTGKSQYVFRHLVVYVQKNVFNARPYLNSCWDLLLRWETIEPPIHRNPIPSIVLRAMAVLALHWNWKRFACSICISFFGITRPGEVLQARRRDLVLPSDLGDNEPDVAYLRIVEPKSRRRGRGRVQHASLTDPSVIVLLESVFGKMERDQLLYPISAGSFRRRWDMLLTHLGIPFAVRLTPGCLRSGGAVAEYRKGTDMTRLLWRMRLRHLVTLESYIQEVAGETIFAGLQPAVQRRIRILSEMFGPSLSVF